MIVVTGAAGFIGSCILARLNERGETDILAVDHLDDGLKERNLEGKKFIKYIDKKNFIDMIKQDRFKEDIRVILHMGACSSTTLQDAQYFEENNFLYTKVLAKWAIQRGVRFIYASSAATYGDGTIGYKDDEETIRRCQPLNLYGESKQKFDQWILDQGLIEKVVGLKFFNVFGPNEYHKGDMRSVIAKAYDRVTKEGRMSLFKSYKKDFGDGEQKRDFIYVKDAVDVVMFFVDHSNIHGIFNVGTGQARTWNDLAYALFKAAGKNAAIEYIEMPEILKDKYQYFTQADMSKLRGIGYSKNFDSLEESIEDYARYLREKRYW